MQRYSRFITLVFIAVILTLNASSVTAFDIGDTVSDWTLTDSSGEELNYYQDSKGQVSVLLFWATWCPFCRSLMPHLQEVANVYKDKPVRFYALNVWEENDPVKHMNEQGFTFKLLLSAEAVAGKYHVVGTPGLFVVDQDHRVLYRRSPGTDDFEVKLLVNEAIHEALQEKK